MIDNLEAAPADRPGLRPADTKPGRGLTEAALTEVCHTRLRALDRHVLAILQRTLRPDLYDPERGLRYDTRIAIFRGEAPETYRADVYLVDPASGARHPIPLEVEIRVEVDAAGRLTGGHLDVPVHALPDGPDPRGSVAIVQPLFGGVDAEPVVVVSRPIGGPVPAAPETFWDFDWGDVLDGTAWNAGS